MLKQVQHDIYKNQSFCFALTILELKKGGEISEKKRNMKIIVEYSIKKEELENVLSAIKLFINEVKINEPETHYQALRKENSFDFVHIMKFKDDEAQKNHSEAPYTVEFVKMLYPRCNQKPVFTNLTEI